MWLLSALPFLLCRGVIVSAVVQMEACVWRVLFLICNCCQVLNNMVLLEFIVCLFDVYTGGSDSTVCISCLIGGWGEKRSGPTGKFILVLVRACVRATW